jgi:hypothetical protein
MRFLVLILVMFLAVTAHARVPGSGRPILIVMCASLAEALVMVERFVAGEQYGATPSTCRGVNPFYPTDLENQKLVAGPLVDWEGDPFALYEVNMNSGGIIYAFVWWRPEFSPIGTRI